MSWLGVFGHVSSHLNRGPGVVSGFQPNLAQKLVHSHIVPGQLVKGSVVPPSEHVTGEDRWSID